MPVDTSRNSENDDDHRKEDIDQDDKNSTEVQTGKNIVEVENSIQDDRTTDKELSEESSCKRDGFDTKREPTSQLFSDDNEIERVMDHLPAECDPSRIVRKIESSPPTTDSNSQNLEASPNTTVSIEFHGQTETDLDLGLSLSKGSSESSSDNSEIRKDADTESSVTSNCSVTIDLSEQMEAQNTSTQGDQDQFESEPTCRICHCGNESEPLISPCLCTGTVKHIHHSCLMDWLKRCVKTKCELCLHPILVHRKTKPLNKWRRPGQKPTPLIWLLTFVVALTLNIASIAKDGSQKCVSNPCIIFYVVGALGALLGFAFFYHWLKVSIRYIKQWMALNEEWTLVGSDKAVTLGNANLALSDKSLGSKQPQHISMVEIV